MSKPTEAEAKALAKFFPSTKSKSSGGSFDPTADCVVVGQQKKKKAAIKPKPRPISISVVMMKKYSPIVPIEREETSATCSSREDPKYESYSGNEF